MKKEVTPKQVLIITEAFGILAAAAMIEFVRDVFEVSVEVAAGIVGTLFPLPKIE